MSTDRKGPIDEREWDAQERGMHAARRAPIDPLDTESEAYRRLAEIMDSAPIPGPPANFAASVVAQVARQEEGFERLLWRGLVGAFAVATVSVLLIFGEDYFRLVSPVLGPGMPNLLLIGGGCAVLSWMGRRLFPRSLAVAR
jgi:hypothetical protein